MPDRAFGYEKELAALHAASFGWALACCRRDRDQASDVLQQAYWKVLSGRARFSGMSAFKTWFFGVIRLTAEEQRRWTSFRWLRRDEPPASTMPDPTTGADQSIADRQEAARLSAALAEIAPRQREVLHLVFYEELSIREAADVMGVSLGTARLHYDRGKKAVAAILARRGSDHER